MRIVDRVIFSLTNNPDYLGFWNFVSKVYHEKFDTVPTLFFSGNQEEFDELRKLNTLSDDHGEIFLLERSPDILIEQRDWTCTWGAYYGASRFENDRCMISGIDQIPLGDRFFKMIKALLRDNKYVVGFSDGYNHPGADFPSSHHVGFGSQFKSIYEINESWPDELRKIYNWRVNLPNFKEGMSLWGIDEAYSSFLIRKHLNDGSNEKIELVKNFHSEWGSRRIDRSTGKIRVCPELITAIESGELSEYHSIRPFEANENMDLFFDLMPKFENKL